VIRFRLFVLLLCCALSGRGQTDESETEIQAGWVELSRLNPGPAEKLFAASHSREARLGAALATFTIQPLTTDRLTETRAQLESLITENAADDFGIAATYYLARLPAAQNTVPDSAATLTAYRKLLHDHPGHPIAELAAPKLAILLVYADVPDTVWETHVAEITALLSQLESPAARRDTRLALADALLRLHRDHARALPLIAYCLEENLIVRPPRLGMMLLQAAESARELHRSPEAIRYYRRYLTEFPLESKTDEIRRRLQALETEAGS
jgi:hypothetical protein